EQGDARDRRTSQGGDAGLPLRPVEQDRIDRAVLLREADVGAGEGRHIAFVHFTRRRPGRTLAEPAPGPRAVNRLAVDAEPALQPVEDRDLLIVDRSVAADGHA